MKNPECIFCKSPKVIKHGKTTTGNPRYRCRVCSKTWVLEKPEVIRPDIADITEAYLNGRTCRDLVNVYHSSPLRINKKIREFLEGVPHWEQYVDTVVSTHEPKLVYLMGRSFACACDDHAGNSMFVAFAIDALSSMVLGFEIAPVEDNSVWLTLLDRMNCRGIMPQQFMATGSKTIEDAVKVIYPYSLFRINYHRIYRDKELNCCLSRLPINNKLLNDAVKVYNSLDNKNLQKYLKRNRDKKLQEIIFSSQEEFISRLNERFSNKSRIRLEGLSTAFQTRFEKFHMLKGNPVPVINGWLSLFMLRRLDFGFNRLSLYSQIPSVVSFKDFACGNLPTVLYLNDDSAMLKTFVIEIAARGLQLPIVFSTCEMKFDKCSLF